MNKKLKVIANSLLVIFSTLNDYNKLNNNRLTGKCIKSNTFLTDRTLTEYK